jgi:hypothetical protein
MLAAWCFTEQRFRRGRPRHALRARAVVAHGRSRRAPDRAQRLRRDFARARIDQAQRELAAVARRDEVVSGELAVVDEALLSAQAPAGQLERDAREVVARLEHGRHRHDRAGEQSGHERIGGLARRLALERDPARDRLHERNDRGAARELLDEHARVHERASAAAALFGERQTEPALAAERLPERLVPALLALERADPVERHLGAQELAHGVAQQLLGRIQIEIHRAVLTR